MISDNFDNEEATDEDLKSVAFTTGSVIVFLLSVILWLLYTLLVQLAK